MVSQLYIHNISNIVYRSYKDQVAPHSELEIKATTFGFLCVCLKQNFVSIDSLGENEHIKLAPVEL